MDQDDLIDPYEAVVEILDEGRLPVVCFLRPGLVYYRSFDIEDWSPVMTGDDVEREDCLVRIMRFTFNEGVRSQGADS